MKLKGNSSLVNMISLAKKNEKWLNIASLLTYPRSKRPSINLDKINHETKEGDKILIPGKVLSVGELTKKIEIIAVNFSKEAIEKIKKSKSEFKYIEEEIKENPKAEGIKIIQ